MCVCVCQDLLLFGSEGARRRRRITIITDFIHPPLETRASRAVQHPIGRGWVLWRPPGTGKLDGRPPRQRRSGTHGGAVCSGDHDGSWRVRVRVRVKLTTPPPPPPPQIKKYQEETMGSGGCSWGAGTWGRSGTVDTWGVLEPWTLGSAPDARKLGGALEGRTCGTLWMRKSRKRHRSL